MYQIMAMGFTKGKKKYQSKNPSHQDEERVKYRERRKKAMSPFRFGAILNYTILFCKINKHVDAFSLLLNIGFV